MSAGSVEGHYTSSSPGNYDTQVAPTGGNENILAGAGGQCRRIKNPNFTGGWRWRGSLHPLPLTGLTHLDALERFVALGETLAEFFADVATPNLRCSHCTNHSRRCEEESNETCSQHANDRTTRRIFHC